MKYRVSATFNVHRIVTSDEENCLFQQNRKDVRWRLTVCHRETWDPIVPYDAMLPICKGCLWEIGRAGGRNIEVTRL